MAHIFLGNRAKVDEEVLDRVRNLPDDYWVFGEFDVTGRNIDWFVVRAVTGMGMEQHSVLILTELKRTSGAIEGAVDETWRLRSPDGSVVDIAPNSQSDLNYYWQSVNAANALSQWLWNNQQRFLDPSSVRPLADFKVWPDLLIVSPPDIIHRLPLQPPSRYGQWWYRLDEWYRHVETWRPRIGVGFTVENLRSLAQTIGLHEYQSESAVEPVAPRPSDSSSPALLFAAWLSSLEARIKRIEERLGMDQ